MGGNNIKSSGMCGKLRSAARKILIMTTLAGDTDNMYPSKYNTTNERRRAPKSRNLNMRMNCRKTAIDITHKSTQNVTNVEKRRITKSAMGAFVGYVLNGGARKSANFIRGGFVRKHWPILTQRLEIGVRGKVALLDYTRLLSPDYGVADRSIIGPAPFSLAS